jgi:hypothetical protein
LLYFVEVHLGAVEIGLNIADDLFFVARLEHQVVVRTDLFGLDEFPSSKLQALG